MERVGEGPLMDWHTAPIGKFWWLVGHQAAEHPFWRAGQCTFNTLAAVRPDLSERIRGDEIDAFNLDSRLDAMCKWIEEHWEDNEV